MALKCRETYGFKADGYGMASKTNKYIINQFWNPINPKDGFAIGDCKDISGQIGIGIPHSNLVPREAHPRNRDDREYNFWSADGR